MGPHCTSLDMKSFSTSIFVSWILWCFFVFTFNLLKEVLKNTLGYVDDLSISKIYKQPHLPLIWGGLSRNHFSDTFGGHCILNWSHHFLEECLFFLEWWSFTRTSWTIYSKFLLHIEWYYLDILWLHLTWWICELC